MAVIDGLNLLCSKGIRKVVRRLAKRMEKLKPIGRGYDSFTMHGICLNSLIYMEYYFYIYQGFQNKKSIPDNGQGAKT